MLARRKILADSIFEEMVGAGFAKESVRLLHGADFRYMGQLSEMYLDLGETDILQDGKWNREALGGPTSAKMKIKSHTR